MIRNLLGIENYSLNIVESKNIKRKLFNNKENCFYLITHPSLSEENVVKEINFNKNYNNNK